MAEYQRINLFYSIIFLIRQFSAVIVDELPGSALSRGGNLFNFLSATWYSSWKLSCISLLSANYTYHILHGVCSFDCRRKGDHLSEIEAESLGLLDIGTG